MSQKTQFYKKVISQNNDMAIILAVAFCLCVSGYYFFRTTNASDKGSAVAGFHDSSKSSLPNRVLGSAKNYGFNSPKRQSRSVASIAPAKYRYSNKVGISNDSENIDQNDVVQMENQNRLEAERETTEFLKLKVGFDEVQVQKFLRDRDIFLSKRQAYSKMALFQGREGNLKRDQLDSEYMEFLQRQLGPDNLQEFLDLKARR